MQLSKKKNTIILKGMASNVVEEAIVVLKPNVKLKSNIYDVKKCNCNIDKKMMIVNEAQKTINEYVCKIQKNTPKSEINRMKKRYKMSQIFNVTLIITMITTILILL